ncbi:hypothetical protein HIM_01003 [Hirsutella minnesotensis 3608]|nr:hypothetical protein HIM_01003 [Hirsutella minnesotensis 3608]
MTPTCPIALRSKPSPQEEFRRIQCHYPLLSSTGCTRSFCQSGRMVHTDEQRVGIERDIGTVETEAIDFLHQLFRDGIIESKQALQERILTAIDEIRGSSVFPGDTSLKSSTAVQGTWHQTVQELEHGLRLSWKHARKQ